MKSWNLTLSSPSTSMLPIKLIEHHLYLSLIHHQHVDTLRTDLCCVCMLVFYLRVSVCVCVVSLCACMCHVCVHVSCVHTCVICVHACVTCVRACVMCVHAYMCHVRACMCHVCVSCVMCVHTYVVYAFRGVRVDV